jgi:hypothetical protein
VFHGLLHSERGTAAPTAGGTKALREQRGVRWFVWVLVAYVVVVGGSIAAIGYLGRAEGGSSYQLMSLDGQYRLEGYRYLRLPFQLSGRGRAPGEVRVLSHSGQVIEEAQLEDVESVQHVTWDKFNVTFTFERGGRTYQTSLDLPQ